MSLLMVIGRIGSTELVLLIVIVCVIIFGLKKKNGNASTTSHSGTQPTTAAHSSNSPQTSGISPKQTPARSASTSQNNSADEWVIQKTVKLFDEAVETLDDAAAIIHGTVLIDNGQLIHVLVGMNKLSDAGCKDCTVMAANLTLQIALSLHGDRQAETSFYGMQCTEIKNALDRIHRDKLDIDAELKENIATIEEELQYEYVYWQMVAYRECGDKKHRDLALRGLNDLSSTKKAEFFNENSALLGAIYGT